MTENNVSLNAPFQFSFWYISLWLSSKRQFHDEINIFSGKVTKRFRCIRKSLHNIFKMIRYREQIPQSETLVRSWLIPFIPDTYTYSLKGNPRQSWILDSTPRILDPRYWIPDSLSCIPDSKVPDSGSHKQKFSGFWNRDSLIWPGRATPQVIVAFSADRVRKWMQVIWQTPTEFSCLCCSYIFISGVFCFSFVFGYGNVCEWSWNKGKIKITWVKKITTAYTYTVC